VLAATKQFFCYSVYGPRLPLVLPFLPLQLSHQTISVCLVASTENQHKVSNHHIVDITVTLRYSYSQLPKPLCAVCPWFIPCQTYRTTHRRQSPLSTHLSDASSHDMPISFKSCLMASIQFFLGLPGFHFVISISQCMTCFGSQPSSIHKMCQNISVFLP